MSRGVSAAGLTPRKRSGRLARRPSRGDHFTALVFSGPATGLAGDRGCVRGARAPSGAQRSDLRADPIAKQASVLRSRTDSKAAIPGHGRGPPRASVGSAGLTGVASGMEPIRGKADTPVARRAARRPSPRNEETPGPQRLGCSVTTATCPVTGGRAHGSSVGSSGPVLRHERRYDSPFAKSSSIADRRRPRDSVGCPPQTTETDAHRSVHGRTMCRIAAAAPFRP